MAASPTESDDDHMNSAVRHQAGCAPQTTQSLGESPARPAPSAAVLGTLASGGRSPTNGSVHLARSLDPESQAWVDRLSPQSPVREAAVEALHGLLLKAARFEINRRRGSVPHLHGDDHDDLAHQSADDALVAVLRKLGDFRGDSRFTTWAYKFALLEAATKVRRRAWQAREVQLEPEAWTLIADPASTPQQDVETKELLAALQEAIEADLTAHQREVLVAVTLNDVPIDVLANRLNSSRGALYKTIHDARRKLRTALAARGLGVSEYESCNTMTAASQGEPGWV
jgi:RNA polymerase sigma-70 factor, ECF subfamily